MAQVVIGVVEQYGPAILKPFLKSLALTGYEGDVVFFVSKLPDETKMFLDDFGVRKIHFRIHQFKGLWFWKHATLFMNRTIPARWPLRDPIVSKLWHCQASRYFFYRNFLRKHPHYEEIVITDVRDVVFQKNPFSGPALESLEVFEEAPRFCLESEVHNRRWIQEVYGESVLKMLGKHLVICSGVTVGKRSGILSYLDKMTDSLSRYYASTGFDQAVHNYLLRTLNVPDWLIRKFGDGRVIHVGTAAWNDLSLDASGNVVNDRGEPFSILHQYDRHPELVENVMRKLAA